MKKIIASTSSVWVLSGDYGMAVWAKLPTEQEIMDRLSVPSMNSHHERVQKEKITAALCSNKWYDNDEMGTEYAYADLTKLGIIQN